MAGDGSTGTSVGNHTDRVPPRMHEVQVIEILALHFSLFSVGLYRYRFD